MEITEVKVFPIQEEKLKAFVSIVFDQCFMVNDIKIIQGRDGLFISMPSRKKKNGEFKDVAHPLNNETRRMIEDKILGEYERVLGARGPHAASLPAGDHLPMAHLPHTAGAASHLASGAGGGASGATAGDPLLGQGSPERRERLAAAAERPAAAAAPEDGNTPASGAGSAIGRSPELPAAPEAKSLAPGGAPGVAAKPGHGDEKSLEEIEEMHLRDSFWTVT
jgi:stage V sporulation protein G